jgi:UDP-N-acetylmuramoylalanine--D-glutamate ligase
VIGKILETAGIRSAVAGNIGNPFAELIAQGSDCEVIVLELSSFQLDTITDFKSDVAVLLNVTPDHLDRYHHSFDEYAASKARILNRSDDNTWFVYNRDDAVCGRIAGGFGGNAIPFSSTTRLEDGLFLEGDEIKWGRSGRVETILSSNEFKPVGIHNLENAMAAVAAVAPFEIETAAVRDALRSYRPLPHRMEVVRVTGGVTYINDSKATNVDATVKSLMSIKTGAILILGGKDKEGDFRALIPHLGRVRVVVLIGEASAAIRTALNGHCDLTEATDMQKAVETARDHAIAGDTVLLAPACASFDMFSNYQERGEVFSSCVNSL